MCNKIDINEINKIPKEEFSKMLQSWMENEEIRKMCEKELRKSLIQSFMEGTLLGKKMKSERKKSFDPKNNVLDVIEAEHLYCNKYFLTLSLYSTESRKDIPNFENENYRRFDKREVQEYLEVLGLMKDDTISKHICSTYKANESQSLLSILLKVLISNHRKSAVESRTTSTQTITKGEVEHAKSLHEKSQVMDLSQISHASKPRRKSHRLVTTPAGAALHHKTSTSTTKKSKSKSKGMALIAHSLELMANNINLITNKLNDFQKSSSHDDSKAIIVDSVGAIMQQLEGCVKNFGRLCDDIKAISDAKLPLNYDEWMRDLKHSDHGRKFLKKITKSFARLLDEEKAKVKSECRRKFDKDKKKIAKFYQSRGGGRRDNDQETLPAQSKFAKDIHEIYEATALKLKNIERENELFEKTIIYCDNNNTSGGGEGGGGEDLKAEVTNKVDDLDLNKCRRIHSKEESSSINTNPHAYSSDASFDEDISETNI